MIPVGSNPGWVASVLRSWYALDEPDAALITELAQAEGSHHIPGSEGCRLVFDHGAWYITRKDGR